MPIWGGVNGLINKVAPEQWAQAQAQRQSPKVFGQSGWADKIAGAMGQMRPEWAPKPPQQPDVPSGYLPGAPAPWTPPPGYGEGTGSNSRDSSDWAQRHPEDPMLNPQQPEAPWWERGTFPTSPTGPIRWNPGERITIPPMYAPEGEYSLTGGPYRGPNPNAIPISNQQGGGTYPYGFSSPTAQQKLGPMLNTIGSMVKPISGAFGSSYARKL